VVRRAELRIDFGLDQCVKIAHRRVATTPQESACTAPLPCIPFGIHAPNVWDNDGTHGEGNQKKEPSLPPAEVSGRQEHQQGDEHVLGQKEQNQAASIDLFRFLVVAAGSHGTPSHDKMAWRTSALLIG